MRFPICLILVCCLLASSMVVGLSGCTSATDSDALTISSEPVATTDTATLTESVSTSPEAMADTIPESVPEVPKLQTATFGAGCFWCVEAVFEQLKSVENVRSGYAGGKAEDADYKLVSNGNTGHAEVIEFEFDPSVITYKELLEVFWTSHDPTTLNQQGADVGTQYRSAVFYHNDEQRQLAETYKKSLNDENAFGKPVVTEIVKFDRFYPAEGYHQDYFAQNSSTDRYCHFVIRPKVEKIRKVFADKLK